ncbi:hypothetical protein PMAYCL1PPCAC_00925 [Pristionchus mayeri]|uniref:glutathione transferase n=1 Tax=Pristionchus mayeri TaxID=1317129 RepID=A0AAN4Z3S6_9BILA|nr:hypothetical protein PMAYCL1PPCAC_00925 [Pristionchus mayeri]
MPTYKLSYFEGQGLGEVSRQLLHLSETPFEDDRISQEDWPKRKDSMPFAKLPVLFVDGKPLPQSLAIARYLANQFGFAGKTPFESAWVDALGDQFKDYFSEMVPYFMALGGDNEEEKSRLQLEVAEPAINKFFSILEKRAKDNGSNGHFVGDSITWIDILISDHMGVGEKYFPNAYAAFPTVLALREGTVSLPKLKEWIEQRPVTPY